MNKLAILIACSSLTGCASVSAVQLDANAEGAQPGAVQGFRVPRMMPYLLVAALPVAPKAVADAPNPQDVAPPPPKKKLVVAVAGAGAGGGVPPPLGAPGGAPAKKDDKGAAAAKDDGAGDKSGDAEKGDAGGVMSPGSGSDTSFAIGNTVYAMKIIYLPDYRHATAVRIRSGLFGVANMQISFQNGMMTSLSTKVDNTKAADVATAALQALAKAATGGAAAAAPGGAPQATDVATGARDVLAPGLYAFLPSETGVLGLCRVNQFTSEGAPKTEGCDFAHLTLPLADSPKHAAK